MKRGVLYFILIFCFMLVGCDNEFNNNFQYNVNIDESIIMDEYIDDNPIKVGLYDDYDLVKSYSTTLGNYNDIGVFSVYFTNKEKLDSKNTKKNFKKYYSEYENIEKYKIGFYVSFYVNDKLYEQVILDPYSKHKLDPYLYVYLYDDVNQKDGSWYSHLEPEDMKDNTIISSIKLFLAGAGNEITSPIKLTVFTYDSDDFNDKGMYRGISSYTINIDTK